MADDGLLNMTKLTRRTLLRYAVIAASGVPLSAFLAACADDEEQDTAGPDEQAEEPAEEIEEPLDEDEEDDELLEEETEETEDGEEDEGAAAGGDVQVVEMTQDRKFVPERLTIVVGDTVTWRNAGSMRHTSTCDPEKANEPSHVQLPDGADTWDSGLLNEDEEFQHTFETAGEYTYFCIPHEAAGMIGYITVEEA